MSRRSNALERYSVDVAIVNYLFDGDPSGGALGDWMVWRVARGEHPDEVFEAVCKFHDVKDRLPKDSRDLYAYGNVESVLDAVKRVPPSKRKKRRTKKGYTVLREFPRVTFYRVTTFAGMQALGRDTKWCTTKHGDYKRYSDCMFVVAVSRLREERDRYSKIMMVLRNTTEPDPNRIISYKTLYQENRYMRASSWEFYDAKDHQVTGRYGSEDPSPLEEMLDLLAGERGVTREILLEVQEGTDYSHLFEKIVVPFVRRERGAKATEVVEVAQAVVEHGLFNPLSLLDHPSARSKKTCSDIIALATKDHWDALTRIDFYMLAQRPAVNVPEVLEEILVRSSRADALGVATTLLRNRKLTKQAKRRVAEYVRSQVLGLG